VNQGAMVATCYIINTSVARSEQLAKRQRPVAWQDITRMKSPLSAAGKEPDTERAAEKRVGLADYAPRLSSAEHL